MSASSKSSVTSMTDERDDADEPRREPAKKKKKKAAPTKATTAKDAEKKAYAAAAAKRLEEAESERRLARSVAIALPVATVGGAATVGVLSGLGPAILVLAGGVILAAVAAVWASVRTLTGDAPLPVDLEAADMRIGGGDSRVAKKTMLLRALKDLENEHAIGKLSDDDYASIAPRYVAEIKEILREIDAELGPHRPRAEQIAKAHLRKVGLVDSIYRDGPPGTDDDEPAPAAAPRAVEARDEEPAKDEDEVEDEVAKGDDDDEAAPPAAAKPSRRTCPSCDASNEVDAKFCKSCGKTLEAAAAPKETSDDAS